MTKTGHGLAKVLGIKLPYRDPLGAHSDPVTRGESTFSYGTVETYSYLEPEPTTAEWLKEICPTWHDVLMYFYNLFPFLSWITKYNLQWFFGDLVAGITVGAVVVPQGMAYAKLAELPVQYGLYSSFMGVLVYWFFATSKDITIGPVAVMSTLVGTIVLQAKEEIPDVPGHIVASCLAIICGAIVCALGLLRLGFIVDFIPLPAISAFMTGSALNIAAGQVKKLLGESADFSTRGSTYMIIINSLKHLPTAGIDAALGVTALAMLYIIRSICNYGARKYPRQAKVWFFASTLRTVFVILFYTMISAAVNLHRKDNPMFDLLGSVPRGFQDAAVPVVNARIIKVFASQLPACVIVLLIEHIAISKSFGRVNNYTIEPSQELVGIGVTNLLGPFLGAYPATGSFSRTAIKSKAGVRTPLAGCITAIVVLLAIYALTAVFFYIPQAALSGVIIHAVGDLITPPNTVYQFWRVSPLDAIIFFIGVIAIFRQTRRTNPFSYARPGDRPWNDPGSRKGKEESRSQRPILRAIILDFSSVNNVDVTSIQNLIDVRNQLDLYASPRTVQWHFAHINNRWTKRALAAAGFGYPTPASDDGFHRWKPIFSVAEIEGRASAAAHAEMVNNEHAHQNAVKRDLEEGLKHETHMTEREASGIDIEASSDNSSTPDDKLARDLKDSKAYRNRRKAAVVQGINRPFFHIDLTSALESALANSPPEEPIEEPSA
ncbi:sulfate transporter [Aspergillus luchuensis]|uniref:Sulfate transporter n=1 Tax=Aspergillus kawachii TaxID=1069201 RepID=A0A146FQ93_ASPKA|nr:sulfate transporter [Aspergillus luchuensis]